MSKSFEGLFGHEYEALLQSNDPETLIALSKVKNKKVRVAAVKMMCPCRVKKNEDLLWDELEKLSKDEDKEVRYQVLHNFCDGSPDEMEHRVIKLLDGFNKDPDPEIRRRAHKVMGKYLHEGRWNVL